MKYSGHLVEGPLTFGVVEARRGLNHPPSGFVDGFTAVHVIEPKEPTCVRVEPVSACHIKAGSRAVGIGSALSGRSASGQSARCGRASEGCQWGWPAKNCSMNGARSMYVCGLVVYMVIRTSPMRAVVICS